MAPAAFKASYADWKLIRSRKCVQIVFEVSLEAADAAYQVVGGMPDPGGSEWFAIARLNEKATEAEKPATNKRSWHDMSPAQQAGILCADPKFGQFMSETTEYTHTDVPLMVRQYCGVDSRSEIIPGTLAAKFWQHLVEQYRAWEREPEVIG